MPNEQALNKKLAEWAGFRLDATGVNKEIPVWVEPDGKIPFTPAEYYLDGINYHLPDFSNSLDACFKWLVPKLPDYYITFTIYPDNIVEAYIMYYPNGKDNALEEAYGQGETSALALCLAIEKLIDKE